MGPYSGGGIDLFAKLIRNVPTISESTGIVTVTRQTQIVLVGSGETPPRPELKPAYFNVMADISGQKVPYDRGFNGIEAVSSIELALWDEDAVAALRACFNFQADVNGIGWLDEDSGTLMNTEGWSTELFYRSKRRNVAAMQAVDMRGGEHYYGTVCMGSARSGGNKQNTMFLAFGHIPVRLPGSIVSAALGNGISALSGNQGGFLVMDHDMSQVESLAGT